MTQHKDDILFDNGVFPATVEDFEGVLDTAYRMADCFGFGFTNKDKEALYNRVVDAFQNGVIFVAKKDGKVVGVLALYLCRHFFDVERYYSDLFFHVHEEHRNSRYCFQLLKAAQTFVELTGRKLMINTYSPNQLDRVEKALTRLDMKRSGGMWIYNESNLRTNNENNLNNSQETK